MTLGHGWDWGIFNFLWPWIISWWHLWTCAPRFPGLSKSSYDPAGLFPFPLDAGPRSEDQAEDWCRRESCKFKTLQTPKHCARQKTIIIKVISPALQPNSRFQASRVLFQLLGSAKNDAPPTDIIYVPMISMFFLWLTREFTTRSAASDGPWLSTGVTPWATWLLARSKFQLCLHEIIPNEADLMASCMAQRYNEKVRLESAEASVLPLSLSVSATYEAEG